MLLPLFARTGFRVTPTARARLCRTLCCESALTNENYVKFRKKMLQNVPLWYPSKFNVTHAAEDVIRQFSYLEKGQDVIGETVQVAGRIHSIRRVGNKLSFIDVLGNDAKVQIKIASASFKGSPSTLTSRIILFSLRLFTSR